MNIKEKLNKMMNEIDPIDINGNYIYDPLHTYQPIRRCGNDIYFYADVDSLSQLALIQLLQDAQADIISRNATKMLSGEPCKETITIHINSYGGLLSSGFALYDYIRNLKVTTIGHVEGVAASAASLILLACNHRTMLENSTVLLHQLSGGVLGTYEEIKDHKLNVDRAMKKLYKIYLEQTSIGFTDEMDAKLNKLLDKKAMDPLKVMEVYHSFDDQRLKVLSELLKHDLELSIEECLTYGIIDSLESEEGAKEQTKTKKKK